MTVPGVARARAVAQRFVATLGVVREFTRENMSLYIHEDLDWQAGVARFSGIDAFVAAHNQAWRTLGYPVLHDIEIDAGDGFAVISYTLVGTHELPMMGQAATGRPIAMPALLVLRLRDGRIAHLRTMSDNVGAMRVSSQST